MATAMEEACSTASDHAADDDSPIEQVRLIVPVTDDPALPVLTLRVWVMGLSSCVFLAATGQFFSFRQTPIGISPVIFVILSLPVGKLMARILPSKSVRVPATNWEFHLNPGPFNIKEHVLVSFLASCGSLGAFAMSAIIDMDLFYHRKVHPLAAISLVFTVQLVGYGFAGFFMKLFVESPKMWFPGAVATVAYFRTLHEKERRVRGQLSRMQFFIITSVLSFAYYIIPGYYFPSITALSFVCWKWKDSVLAQQIGSGRNGLGLGSFAFDWATITAFNDSPFVLPTFSIANSFAGYLLFLCVVVPIAYWSDMFDAKRYPIFSSITFDANAREYNFSRILDDKFLRFSKEGYNNYSKIHLSVSYVFYYGMYFATVGAGISQFIIFHGRTTWEQVMSRRSSEGGDVHNRLMKSYPVVPLWWFLSILLGMVGLSIYICEGFGKQLQLPVWIVFLSLFISVIILLPTMITFATAGQYLSLGMIPTLIITYSYPGRPLADYVSNLYSGAVVFQAASFLSDFKVGHYMKIPPRAMFITQIVGVSVSCLVNYGVFWWLFSTIDNMCEPDKLPRGSPWTCPGQRLGFNDNIIWNLIGPRRVFFPDGEYRSMYLFFLVGVLGPCVVWMASRASPAKKWIELVDIPVVFNSAAVFPASAVNVWSWSMVGLSYNLVVLNKFKDWWVKYNYMLSSGLDVGVAFTSLLMVVVVNSKGVYGPRWWGLAVNDHCPLATCPTAPGMRAEGCPHSSAL